MTYTSYDAAPAENEDYTEELPLDERFKQTPVPLLVIFGEEDQLFDAAESIEGYADVPGVQTELIEGAGHAPQVEKPEEVAELLEKFSVPPEIKRVKTKPPKKRQAQETEGQRRSRSRGLTPKTKSKRRTRPTRGSDPTARARLTPRWSGVEMRGPSL